MATVENVLSHEALVYSSGEAFLARVLPFLQEGLAAGQPAIAALSPEKFAPVREALGHEGKRVSFVDASTHYRRPSNALAEYRRELEVMLSQPGVELVRVIGELPLALTREEQDEWIRYESLINQAWADYPVWVVCGYDTRVLPDDVIARAAHTHPFVSRGARPDPSPGYIETDQLVAPPLKGEPQRATTAPGPLAGLTIAGEPELADLRRVVTSAARAGGLPPPTVEDVAVAAAELARDGLRRGEGQTSVQVIRDQARWHCDVTRPGSGSADELGLFVARLVSEHVEVADGGGEQTVRMTFSGVEDVRRRILDAASELFYQHGIRATGINTIIAHSGVAKATFFRHFPAKHDLVVAWLEEPSSRWFDRIRTDLEARNEAPASRLLSFFDRLGEWFGQDEFRGCAFQNAAAETPEAAHPVRQATQDYAAEIQDYLRRTADEAGLSDPVGVAEQLHLLAQGAIATAVVTRSARPAKLARAAAERILN